MYNIFKGQIVPESESARQIIDSNERMEKIIEEHQAELARLAEERRQQLIDDYLMTLEADEEGKPIIPTDEEGNPILPVDDEGNQLLYLHSDGFLAEEPEPEPEPEPEEPEVEEVPEPEPEEPPINREEILAEIQKEGDEILAQARAEAEELTAQMKAEAEEAKSQAEAMKAEAEELKAQAIEEGRQAGHDEGYQSGYEEGSSKAEAEFAARVSEMEAEYATKAEALESENRRVIAEYKEKESDIEHQVVDVFCDIIDKVFKIEFSDKKEIMLHLVDNVITNTPGSKEYLIRINDKNFDIINDNRAALVDKIGSGVELDIVKDPLLGEEECQIETDGGVYDCGMDVQLSNLLKDLKALSLV